MSAKKLFAAAMITSLLTACGGNSSPTAVTTPMSTDPSLAGSSFAGSSFAGSSTLTDPTLGTGSTATTLPAVDTTASADPSASGTASTTDPTNAIATASGTATPSTFTLKGQVVNQATGAGLPNATVSIAGHSVLTNADGTFQIPSITDTQIWVTVTDSGYQPVTSYEVDFSAQTPTANKLFQLATAATTSTTTGSTTGTTTTTTTTTTTATAGFLENGQLASGQFTSLAAMVLSGDIVYLLGEKKGLLWINHNTVEELRAADGTVLETFSKVGFLSYIDKSCTGIQVTNGQVTVSGSSYSYAFSPVGQFLQKSAPVSISPVTTVTDSVRGITYSLTSSDQVTVTINGTAKVYPLSTVADGRSLGLDSSGRLYILDDINKVVHQFTFTPGS